MREVLVAEADVPEGGATCVTANEKPYALFKVGGKLYLLDGTCTHAGGPLCEGYLDEFVVTCPWHSSQFDIRTGKVIGPPARTPVRSYPAQVEDDKVVADLP